MAAFSRGRGSPASGKARRKRSVAECRWGASGSHLEGCTETKSYSRDAKRLKSLIAFLQSIFFDWQRLGERLKSFQVASAANIIQVIMAGALNCKKLLGLVSQG